MFDSKRLNMPIKHHDLKTETAFFQATERGDKTFEVRKNDRDFQRFDMVVLHEVVNGIPTGRKLAPMEIIYILPGGAYGIAPDYCVMQLRGYGISRSFQSTDFKRMEVRKMNKLIFLLLLAFLLVGCIPPPYYGGYQTGTYGYHYYDGYVGEGYYHNYHGHTRYGRTPYYRGHGGHRR
jgi:hypothetical protein